MLQMMMKFYDQARTAIEEGATVEDILGAPVIERINRSRYVPEDEFGAYKDDVLSALDEGFAVAA
jgi:V/A-type H+-transporting ATPase subunit A